MAKKKITKTKSVPKKGKKISVKKKAAPKKSSQTKKLVTKKVKAKVAKKSAVKKTAKASKPAAKKTLVKKTVNKKIKAKVVKKPARVANAKTAKPTVSKLKKQKSLKTAKPKAVKSARTSGTKAKKTVVKSSKTAVKNIAKKSIAIKKTIAKAAPIDQKKKAIASIPKNEIVKEPAVKKETITEKAAATIPAKVILNPFENKANKTASEKLAEAAINGILEKKGKNISVLNLSKIQNRVCDIFIICQADSGTQVNAIADSIIETVRIQASEKPYRSEGFQNSEWILIDYVNIVVHVFQSQIRDFYNLEGLWADAEETKIAYQ